MEVNKESIKNNNKLITILKGMIVGGTMLVPGISGGSIAMILGIYDKLIYAVSSFNKHKRKSLLFLGLFSLGGGLGMILFANPLLLLIERYTKPMLYFFLGAVAGGIPLILKQAKVERFSWKIPIYICLGLLIVMLFAVLPATSFDFNIRAGIINFLPLLLVGIVIAIALVLPGISISYVLLVMGLYDETMHSIAELYMPFLVPLGIGLIIGIILTTKTLEHAMQKHPQPTYLIIFGFVLGSMAEVFPGIPSDFEWIICSIMLIAGFFAIQLLSWKENK